MLNMRCLKFCNSLGNDPNVCLILTLFVFYSIGFMTFPYTSASPAALAVAGSSRPAANAGLPSFSSGDPHYRYWQNAQTTKISFFDGSDKREVKIKISIFKIIDLRSRFCLAFKTVGPDVEIKSGPSFYKVGQKGPTVVFAKEVCFSL